MWACAIYVTNVIKDQTYEASWTEKHQKHRATCQGSNRMARWYKDMSVRQITRLQGHRRLTMAHSTWWSLVFL